jgi:hypothetical protein
LIIATIMTVPSRRFPPPWTAEETEACFIVRDHSGQALAYVYFEEEPGRRAAANLLTRDEARRIAANIAKAAGPAAEGVKLVIAGTRVIPLFHRRSE